ncbi:MAG TPA: hypothetical protein VGX21_06860 [Methylomirabilota bacterium]|jgi:ferric-dicitrate binding protein FerR (iron transport regulator)|nr:hypothetical protein [Methylomirabilota bacterium]
MRGLGAGCAFVVRSGRFIRLFCLSSDSARHAWFGGRLMVRLNDKRTDLEVARDRVRAFKERLGL